MHRSVGRLSAIALALFLSNCNFSETQSPATPKLVTPSEAEARQFAEEFVEAVSKPNVTRASMMIDWDVLLDRAMVGTSGSSRFRAGFLKGAKDSTQQAAYVRQLATSIEQGTKLTVLHVRGDEGGRSVLLRILHSTGAVGYNELLLTRDSTGIVRAADVYVYATAEYMSDTVRRMYKFGAASEPTLMDKLIRKKRNPLLEISKQYKEMIDLTAAGKSKEAVALFKQMKPELRREKSVLVAYVTASSSLDDAQYQSAIEELRQAFPNEAGMDLMLIDGMLLKERYDDALAAIDRLDKDLNGDPYLDTLRANILVTKGDLDRAHSHALRASVREKSLIEAQWSLVAISLARGDFMETARLLASIEEEFQIEIGDLTQEPAYAEFVRSGWYRQ